MSGENGLGAGAAVLNQGTQDAINGANVPPANRQGEQRSIADQLRGEASRGLASVDDYLRMADAYDKRVGDVIASRRTATTEDDEKAKASLDNFIKIQESFLAGQQAARDSLTRPIIINNGFQPGDMGYNSYGLANGFMPMGAYNPFTPAGAPMMPQQMAGPQLRAKPDGSFEIVGPDGSIVHNYTNAELSGQLTPQEIAQFGLSPAQQESIKQFEEQREKARKEIEKAVSDLQGANASNLSDEQKQALLKQASDAQVRYNEATKQLNSIQGVNPNRLASFSLDNARDQREHAQSSEAQNIKFYQDWLKDEREFNQKRVQEYERMQRDLHQGDHEMLRRVAQRQMEQDIRNNAGWVRTYQQGYLQMNRAQINSFIGWDRANQRLYTDQGREGIRQQRGIFDTVLGGLLEPVANAGGAWLSGLFGSRFMPRWAFRQNQQINRDNARNNRGGSGNASFG